MKNKESKGVYIRSVDYVCSFGRWRIQMLVFNVIRLGNRMKTMRKKRINRRTCYFSKSSLVIKEIRVDEGQALDK